MNRQGARTKDAGGFALVTDADAGRSNGSESARLVGLWITEFERRTGAPFAKGGRGRLAGTIKNLLASYSADVLVAAMTRWFAIDRDSFVIGIFKTRLEDGDAALTGRAVDRRQPSTFAPAPGVGQSYNGVAKRFQAEPAKAGAL